MLASIRITDNSPWFILSWYWPQPQTLKHIMLDLNPTGRTRSRPHFVTWICEHFGDFTNICNGCHFWMNVNRNMKIFLSLRVKQENVYVMIQIDLQKMFSWYIYRLRSDSSNCKLYAFVVALMGSIVYI